MAQGTEDEGIDMMPSLLVEIDGTQNFLTERFDRIDGRKLHTQTLAAMSPLADTYEDLFVVGRKLCLSAAEQVQQFRRVVFNVLAFNVDDHTKNFSFVMGQDGKWKLSPAYDLIFSADLDYRIYQSHELSILGKCDNITRRDLLIFAQQQDIKNAANIIDEVTEAVVKFQMYAKSVGVSEYWISRIKEVLSLSVLN